MSQKFDRMVVRDPGHTTEPDVRIIIEHFPTLKPGKMIAYGDIENLINHKRYAPRYRSVTDAWRKRVRSEFNVEIGVIDNEGFVVLDDHQRINLASSKLKSGLKKVVKSGDLALRTSVAELTAPELKARDHLVRSSTLVVGAQAESARQLKFELKQIGQSR